MTDQNRPETAEAQGRRAGSEGNVTQATQKINDEIGRHLGNPQFNKEFLESASAELQSRGMLPDMAVDFGKKNFSRIDINGDGYASEGEVRRLMQSQKDSLSPTDLVAGNYLAERLADSKTSMDARKQGMATPAEMDKYRETSTTQQTEYNNAKLAMRAFGDQRDFNLADTDKDGFLTTAELNAKLTDNEKRLAYDKVDPATKQKLEEENRAIAMITSGDNFKKIADANSDTWSSSYISLKDIQKNSAEHFNPGLKEAQVRVTDDLVRTTPAAEAAAKQKEDAAAAQKIKDDKAAAELKAKQDKAAEDEKVLQRARDVEQRRKDEAKALADAQELKERPEKERKAKEEQDAKDKIAKDEKAVQEAKATLERVNAERKAREQAEAVKKSSEAFDKYVEKHLPYTEKNFNDAVKAAAESGKPLVVVVASQKSPDVVTAAAQANLDKQSVVVFLDPSKVPADSPLGKYAQQLIDTHNSAYKTDDKTATAVYSAVRDGSGNATIKENSGTFMTTEQQTLHNYNQGLREIIKQHQPGYVAEVRQPQVQPIAYEQPSPQYYPQQQYRPAYRQQRYGRPVYQNGW